MEKQAPFVENQLMEYIPKIKRRLPPREARALAAYMRCMDWGVQAAAPYLRRKENNPYS